MQSAEYGSATPSLRGGFSSGEGGAYSLVQYSVQIQLSEKPFEHRKLVARAGGVTGPAVALRLLLSGWPRPGLPNNT